MVRAWLEWGVESVLWVNPYPCRLPHWQDLRRTGGLADAGNAARPALRVLDVPALPIEPLPLGLLVESPAAVDATPGGKSSDLPPADAVFAAADSRRHRPALHS